MNLRKTPISVNLYLHFNMGFRDGEYILRMPCSSHNSIYTHIHSVSFNITTHTHSIKKDTDRFIKRIGFALLISRIHFYLIYFCTAWWLWPPLRICQHFHHNSIFRILECKCQNTYLQFTDSSGFVFLLNWLLRCIFTRNIQWWQCLHDKKHHIKQKRSKAVGFQTKTKLNHGNRLLYIHCSCSRLYIIVIVLEQQSKARL